MLGSLSLSLLGFLLFILLYSASVICKKMKAKPERDDELVRLVVLLRLLFLLWCGCWDEGMMSWCGWWCCCHCSSSSLVLLRLPFLLVVLLLLGWRR
jgi:hypothetical protein